MIIDTHVHVWEMPPIAPIGPTAPTWSALPDEAGSADQLLEDMDANGVDAAILVQTSWSTWDNSYVANAANKNRARFRSIGLIDPLDPQNFVAARYWMDEHGMSGFRFHPDYYPDAEIIGRGCNTALLKEIEARQGVVKVHNRVGNFQQLRDAATLFPGITWIIDHMMYPEPQMTFNDWREYQPVLSLATIPNVYLKISDVHNRSRQGFPYSDMHEAVKRAIDAFRIERCMWGTGYPGHHRVKHGWISLEDELRLVKEGFDWLTVDERNALLGATATAVYGF